MRGRRGPFLIALLLFVLALAVKLAYLQEHKAEPDFRYPSLDAKIHDDWAWGLATGEWDKEVAAFAREPYFRAPLYPYLLSFLYRATGRDPFLARLVQVVLGALSVVLIYALTRWVFTPGAALAAALLAVLYWPLTYFEGELLIATLLVALILGLLVSLVMAARRGGGPRWAVAGLFLGLAAMARPNILLASPFLGYWVFRHAGTGKGMRALLFFAAAAVLVIAPVTMRNAVVGKDFVPIASQGGVNFYIGNNPGSDGARAVVQGTRADWWGGYEDTRRIAEQAAGHPLRPSEVSDYWFRRGLEFLAREPGTAARLYLRKLVLLLGNGEVSNNRQIYFVRHRSAVLRALPGTFAFILGLAVLGIVLARVLSRTPAGGASPFRWLPLGVAALYALSVLLFFITSRFRLPVVVALLPYAGYAVDRTIVFARRRELRAVALGAALFLAVFFAARINPYGVGAKQDARGWYDRGYDLANTDPARALKAFDASLRYDARSASAWYMRGWVLEKLGRREAVESMLRATALDSTLTSAFLDLGIVYQKLDREEDAIRCYERVVRLDPASLKARVNLAGIWMQRGEPAKAIPYLTDVLRLDPVNQHGLFMLGLTQEWEGRVEEARTLYLRAGDFEPARLGLQRLAEKN